MYVNVYRIDTVSGWVANSMPMTQIVTLTQNVDVLRPILMGYVERQRLRRGTAFASIRAFAQAFRHGEQVLPAKGLQEI